VYFEFRDNVDETAFADEIHKTYFLLILSSNRTIAKYQYLWDEKGNRHLGMMVMEWWCFHLTFHPHSLPCLP
jgi:hypothetical protein